MRRLIVLLGILLLSIPTHAQNLTRLTERASRLWEFRQKMNRTAALEFVVPEARNAFLQVSESPFSSFKLAGLEFTDNPNTVELLIHVRRNAEGERTVRETWLSKDGQWFMQATASSNPVSAS